MSQLIMLQLSYFWHSRRLLVNVLYWCIQSHLLTNRRARLGNILMRNFVTWSRARTLELTAIISTALLCLFMFSYALLLTSHIISKGLKRKRRKKYIFEVLTHIRIHVKEITSSLFFPFHLSVRGVACKSMLSLSVR